jgi:hypothetical protein
MIIYKGIKTRDKLSFICFTNEHKAIIEIPVSESCAKIISLYLERFSLKNSIEVERGNDEPIEE